MRRFVPVLAVTIGILLTGGLLAFYLHQQVKQEVLAQFSQSQLQIARQAAGQIESYLEARSEEIRHLALLTSLERFDLHAMPPDVEARLAGLKTGQVEDVAVGDAAGQLVYSTGEDGIGSDQMRADLYAWAAKPASRGRIRLTVDASPAPDTAPAAGPTTAAPRLVLATPLYRSPGAGTPGGADGTFGGVLFLTVNLQAVAERSLSRAPTTEAPHPLSIWAMDGDGTLLLQSEHPEMVSRNIRRRSARCAQCHASFDYAERMLAAKQGTVDYQLKGRPGKIAAFAPLTFQNASWIVVVNAPKDDVTGFIQTNFLETIGLFGMVGLVLCAAFFFFYRTSQQETVIAEEAKHLQEKEQLVERLREAGEYLENLFDSANAAIIVWDADLRITRFNRASEGLTGYAADEIVGHDVRQLFPPESREESLSRLQPAPDEEDRESREVPIVRKDGQPRVVLWNSAHIRAGPDEQVVATVAQGQDITERKRAEESLRAADDQLREQAALVRLGEMAAVVAHEVKNPLAGVRGAIQVIGSRLPDGSRNAAVIGDVIARLDALDELMKDLLLFARPPQMHPEPVDVVALARETTALVSQDPAAGNVRFDVDGAAPPLVADPKLLKIVLLNLTLNAVHALQNSGAIHLSVAATDHACRITVADTGPGIPPEIRDRIFVPFFTTKSRGTGLGLSTAKRLVEAHQGRIGVECPAGGGTIVTVELPLVLDRPGARS